MRRVLVILERAPVYDKEIEFAIIVVIEERGSPAYIVPKSCRLMHLADRHQYAVDLVARSPVAVGSCYSIPVDAALENRHSRLFESQAIF